MRLPRATRVVGLSEKQECCLCLKKKFRYSNEVRIQPSH